MAPSDPIPAAELLAESAWLERLARRLVAEPAEAADAAQETLAKALTHAPGAGVPLRRWLAAVLRNAVRQGRRTEERRARRELARAEAGPREGEPADELAARLELHARLVAAVRALEEPYRTTVALRFLEELAPPAVAERMGVPLKTVHTRLERALERLRTRLDRDYGRREAWLAVLLPHFGLPPVALLAPTAPTPLVPFLAMGTLWKWTVAATALAALGFVALRTGPSSPGRLPSVPEAKAAPESAEPPTRTALASEPEAERERASTETSRPPAPSPAAPESPRVVLTGFVRDVEQRPIAGLDVFYEVQAGRPADGLVPAETVRSQDDGRFELPLNGALCRIVARGRGYATLAAPTVMDGVPPEPPVVYVGPERIYAGRVVDSAGNPVAGASLDLKLDESLGRALARGFLTAALSMASTRSQADGTFAFPPVGGAPASTLTAQADGYAATGLELPEESTDALVLTLARPDRSHALAGHVRHGDGAPAAGAYVSVGEGALRCDAEGAFTMPLEPDAAPARLRAILLGFLPAELDLAQVPPEAHQSLELVLGPAALALGGRVEDADGKAVPEARVWTPEAESFGKVPMQIGELSLFVDTSVEDLIAGGMDSTGGREVTADAEGRFELTSLLPRGYTLFALDPRTNELAGPVTVQAGSASVVLRLRGEPRARVAGRVLSFSGVPQAGARVAAVRSVRAPDGSRSTHVRGGGVDRTTDDEGRFAFEALCVEGTELTVARADPPVHGAFDLAREPDLTALELRVPARCHLRVTLDDPGRAEGIEIHDERDQALEITFQIGGAYLTAEAVFLQGLSDLLMVDERARTLVLWKDGKESERIPLALVPGQVNEVRP